MKKSTLIILSIIMTLIFFPIGLLMLVGCFFYPSDEARKLKEEAQIATIKLAAQERL